jgi:hypothetical protein
VKANASPQGLRSRALLGQKLREPEEYINQLSIVNDVLEAGEGDATESHVDEKQGLGRAHQDRRKRRRDRRRAAINELSVNPVDPDAQTFRKPGRAPILGHKTHFLVDGGKVNIITAVETAGACEADGQAVGGLLDKHQAVLGRPARELVGDRGYGSEKALGDCVERGVQPLLGIRAATPPPVLPRTPCTNRAGRSPAAPGDRRCRCPRPRSRRPPTRRRAGVTAAPPDHPAGADLGRGPERGRTQPAAADGALEGRVEYVYGHSWILTDLDGNAAEIEHWHRQRAQMEERAMEVKLGDGLIHFPAGSVEANRAWQTAGVIAHNLVSLLSAVVAQVNRDRLKVRLERSPEPPPRPARERVGNHNTKLVRRWLLAVPGRVLHSGRRVVLRLAQSVSSAGRRAPGRGLLGAHEGMAG